MLENIKINPEFEHLIPPLIDEEFEMLESNILAEGEIYTPLFIWNGYIIDGHHRYKIICEHKNIKFRVVEKEFENKYEAISWMCNNQLGRRNLTPENKKYLIGKRYDAEKKAAGAADGFRGNQYTNLVSDKICHLPKKQERTRKKIADESNVSEGYVMYADEFARGVDAAEEVVPGIKKEILSGKIKKTAKEIAAIAKAPVEERKSLTENLRLTKPNTNASPGVKQNIKSTAVGMRKVDAPVSEESAIETLQGTVDMFIESCESTFVNYPIILVDEEYYKKVLKILDKANKYINKIKGDRN